MTEKKSKYEIVADVKTSVTHERVILHEYGVYELQCQLSNGEWAEMETFTEFKEAIENLTLAQFFK